MADENAGLLEVDIRNLRDINGNRIFEYDYIVGYQFRELFINDIKFVYPPVKEEDIVDPWISMLQYLP